MQYNVIIYIGRFEPVHNGHIATMRSALTQANKLVVVIGSHNTPRDIKNPWTAPERETMIRATLTEDENAQVSFIYAENRLYSDTFWVRNVEKMVNNTIATFGFINPSIGIIGNSKNDKKTAEYINFFKKWKRVQVDCVTLGDMPLHATKIRELIFTGHIGFIKNAIPDEVFQYINVFMKSDIFTRLQHEYDDGIEYEKLYEHAPHKSSNFYTADSVVIQSGHVLLIRRKNTPHKGLFALPGGHVNQIETAQTASLRELIEETRIKVPRKVLAGSLFCEKLFDHPDRSLRARLTKKQARTVTVAFGYKLDDAEELPRVKAGDDAKEARWFTFAEIESMRDQLMEDHADIIEYMISRAP